MWNCRLHRKESGSTHRPGRSSKLEYRGYDSAGMAIFDGAKIHITKSVGRLKALQRAHPRRRHDVRGYLFTLQQMMPEDMAGKGIMLGNLLPAAINLFLLLLVYVLVPNKKVHIKNAFFGALVAIILFWLLRKGFTSAITMTATYKTLYGALATLPSF